MNSTNKEEYIRQEVIEKLLNTSYKEACTHMRWLYKQPITLILKAKEEAGKNYFILKKAHPDVDKEFLSMAVDFLLATRVRKIYDAQKRKVSNILIEDILLTETLRKCEVITKNKANPKFKYLEMNQERILRWRNLGASYRLISEKLTTSTMKISSEYIRKFVENKENTNV